MLGYLGNGDLGYFSPRTNKNTPYVELGIMAVSNVGQLTKVSDGELLALSNFGKRSLREIHSKLAEVRSRGVVVWPTEEKPEHQLRRALIRAARKLQRLKISAGLVIDDRQFGYLVRELGLDAKTAREAARRLILRRVDERFSTRTIRSGYGRQFKSRNACGEG